MKLLLEIEFTPALTKEALAAYGERLSGQMTTIYRSTPGVSKEFIGITHRVIE
jgi:hypothetical protein